MLRALCGALAPSGRAPAACASIGALCALVANATRLPECRAAAAAATVTSTLKAAPPPADPCSVRSDVPCLHVPACAAAGGRAEAVVDGFFVTTTPPGVLTPARQRTRVTLCHSPAGLHVRGNASDVDVFTAATHCNNATFAEGDVLETFLGPVASPRDNPRVYQETDASPSEVLWAGISHRPVLGNVTNCGLGGAGPPPSGLCLTAGVLPNCTGRDTFPGAGAGLAVDVTNSSRAGNGGWWADSLFVPWSLFDGYFASGDTAHAGPGGGVWPLWRLNLYRYDYPFRAGPVFNHTEMELSGKNFADIFQPKTRARIQRKRDEGVTILTPGGRRR